MVIFHSYVKLPEGIIDEQLTFFLFPRKKWPGRIQKKRPHIWNLSEMVDE